MGAAAQIDYDALAQQHGGQTAASAPAIDYDSLAKQHGGSAAGAEPESWYQRTARGLLSTLGLPETLSDVPAMAKQFWFKDPVSGQVPTDTEGQAKNFIENAVMRSSLPGLEQVRDQYNALKDKSLTEKIVGSVPVVGPIANKAASEVRQGNYAGAVGTVVALPLAMEAGSPEMRGAVSDAASATGGAIRSGWKAAGNPFGLASTGEELLTQGISPRTSMTNFAPSLKRAAGDLKSYDANSPIKSVQDLNDAIPEIKQKIWSEEVEPALQRQADKPVNMKPVADAVRQQISPEMREFDEANAEKLDKLADKLESAKDVTSANSLLKYANGQLESYFQKFPAARKANLMNNPETAGWEAARAELRNQFLQTLEANGEDGVRDARLRYGALDTLQDAVERRVNVAARAKPMSLGRIVGLAAAPVTGGTSILLGELSNYLNKPDVLVRRGIGKLPETPSTASAPSRTQLLSPVTGRETAAPEEIFRQTGNP
jgi:hypothetical protein